MVIFWVVNWRARSRHEKRAEILAFRSANLRLRQIALDFMDEVKMKYAKEPGKMLSIFEAQIANLDNLKDEYDKSEAEWKKVEGFLW